MRKTLIALTAATGLIGLGTIGASAAPSPRCTCQPRRRPSSRPTGIAARAASTGATSAGSGMRGVSITNRITATATIAITGTPTTAADFSPGLALTLGRHAHFTRRPFVPKVAQQPGEHTVATIPKTLQPHINTAFPEHVCLVGTALPNGYAQITPRGSTMVLDDDHIALWERGKGSTNAALRRRHQGHGVLPQAAVARRRRAAEGRHRPLLRHRQGGEVGPAVRGGVAQAGAAGEGPRPGEEGLRRPDQGRARRGPRRRCRSLSSDAEPVATT